MQNLVGLLSIVYIKVGASLLFISLLDVFSHHMLYPYSRASPVLDLSSEFCLSVEILTVKFVVQLLRHGQLFCDCMDCSQPGSSVHGISQARIVEWVTISFSKGSF